MHYESSSRIAASMMPTEWGAGGAMYWRHWWRSAATTNQMLLMTGARPARKSASLLRPALLAAILSLAPPPARADQIAPWTFWAAALPQTPLRDVGQVPKWQRVRDWLVSGRDHNSPALSPWIAWAQSLRLLPPMQRLMLIQSRVNLAFPYATDAVVWGLADYWETPAEVVAKGRTDCEGFAIFKLWLARIAGISDDGMGILVGIADDAGEVHADLLVRLDGHDFILDNRRSSIVLAALAGSFRPLMVLDLEDLHVFGRIPSQGIDPASLATKSRPDR
jgi:predicted transglutaminase-like cysteine proteinase